MDNEQTLTGFPESRYTKNMSEGNLAILERKREMLDQLEPHAPKEASEIQRKLEEQLEKFQPTEGRPPAPEFILRQEENWEEIGWKDKDREEVLAQLEKVLGLSKTFAQNALENIVAAHTSPEEAKRSINEDKFRQAFNYYKKVEPQEEQDTEERGDTPQNERSDAEAEKLARYSLLKGMKIRDDYIKRFILEKDWSHENKREYDGYLPADLYELAWNLTVFDQTNFGVNGKFPVLQLQAGYKKNKNGQFEVDERTGEKIWEGRYVINEANFMRWIRSQIMEHYNIDGEDDVTDYFSKIQVAKEQMTSVSLGSMLLNHTRYFTDDTGQKHDDLYAQVLTEPLMLMNLRSYDLKYKSVMGDEGKLAEAITEIFYSNKMTRKTFDKSLMYYLTTLGVDYDGKNSDSRMGEAWNKIFLANYNLGDFAELQKVLGEDSDFFKKKTMVDAINKIYGKKIKGIGLPMLGQVLGEKAAVFEKIYDANGNIKDSAAFTSFVNFFTTPQPDPNIMAVVREALKESVKNLFESTQGNVKAFDEPEEIKGENRVFDEHSLGVADLIANSWLRIGGAGAKNDTGAAGYDAQSKWMRTEAYRRKMATDKRGGAFGNPFTVPQFKQVMVDVFRGTTVADAYTYDEKGKKRKLTPLEVMMRMQEVTRKYERERKKLKEEIDGASDSEKKALQNKLTLLENNEKNDFKMVAGQLEFQENALKQYALDHVNRARHIYDQIMTAHEINFDKFTKYDSLMRGVSFNRAEFQKTVQKDFLTHLRYLLESYGHLNMNMKIRSQVFHGRKPDGSDDWRYETMPLGQAIFGHQILDIPEFRKKAKDMTEEDRDNGYKKKGKYLVNEDGKHVIDYDKVTSPDGKTLAWKQWALMKFGADLWTHISRHSYDPAYGLAHYVDVLEAIESIPGEVMGGETDMRGARVVKPFFSHEQMNWLRKISGTTKFKLYSRAILSDLFTGKHRKDSYFSDSMSIFIGAVFKGY